MPARTAVTNGPVYAVAPTADAVYIGGDFTQLGPRTGPGVRINRSTGRRRGPPSPMVWGGAARVRAATPDGSGGFYVGGDFTHVGHEPRQNLAHVLSDGSVDPGFNPSPNDEVHALAVSGSLVYAAGDFDSIGGESRHGIAALHTNGNVTNWDPPATGCCGNPSARPVVHDLAISGSTVYVAGRFGSIGGQPRDGIAALDATTAEATNFYPRLDAPGVEALAVAGSTVYIGGIFREVGGQTRRSIAALDPTTGAPTSWNPDPGLSGHVLALAVSGSTVYAGGRFVRMGGASRNSLAAIDATTGEATNWNPNVKGDDPSHGATVEAISVAGSTIYAGGDFSTVKGRTRNRIAAIDATTGHATSWDPNVIARPTRRLGGGLEVPGDRVYSIAVSGPTVYAGGDFNSINARTRADIAALDPSTGRVTSWNPTADNTVYALAAADSTVYAGGAFSSIGGQARNRLAAIDKISGDATSWNPNASGGALDSSVRALALSGPTLYAGGYFGSIGAVERNRIAAFDASTGALMAFNPNASNAVLSLIVSGPTVYAGGRFTSIGGQMRNNIAALDASTGAATSWDAHVDGSRNWVTGLALRGSTLYIGGQFSSIAGQPRGNLAALDATTGNVTSWDPGTPGCRFVPCVEPLAVSGATVYAGGTFTSIGGQSRDTIAALDTGTGGATSWDPNPIFEGTFESDDRVLNLAVGPDGSLWAGGTFAGFPRVPQSGIARFMP